MTANGAQFDPVRDKSLQDYRKKLLEHKEVESKLKESEYEQIEVMFCAFLTNHLTKMGRYFSAGAAERAYEAIRQVRE